MPNVVRVRIVAEGVVEPRFKPFSLIDVVRVYSFGWMYWGGSCGRVLLGDYCVAEVCGENVVRYRVFCPGEPGFDVVSRLRDILGLDEDVGEWIRVARGDPLVGGVVEVMPGFRVRRVSVWAATLTAICQQNASFRQGWSMLYKLHILAGTRIVLPDGSVFIATPEPNELNEEVLKKAGLGYRVRTVLDAAKQGVDECRDVPSLAGVRGIGSYTIALVQLLACRRYDVLPLDRWLLRLAAKAYNVPETPRAVENELRRRFGHWTGLAAFETTIAFDAQPIRRALERLEKGLNKPGLDEPSPLTLWRITPPTGV